MMRDTGMGMIFLKQNWNEEVVIKQKIFHIWNHYPDIEMLWGSMIQ